MSSTTDSTTLPARYCTVVTEIPVTFNIQLDTESDLGRQAYEIMRSQPQFLLTWIEGALDVAFTMANARTDDKDPAITVEAHLSLDGIDITNVEQRDLDEDGNVITLD